MTKKNKNLLIAAIFVVIVAAGSITAYHFYRESQKSGLEKSAEKTVDWTDKAVDKTAKATGDAAKWTEKNVNKAADKTKKLFK